MKRLILAFLFLNYASTTSAQLQEHLYKEFSQFVEVQNEKNPLNQNRRPLLFLPFEQLEKANKTSKKMQVLDSIVTISKKDGFTFIENDKALDIFTYDKAGNQTSSREKLYRNDTLITEVKIKVDYKKGNITALSFCSETDSFACIYKADYFYKNDRIVESRFFTSFDLDNEWMLTDRRIYDYKNGELKNIAYFSVDSVSNETKYKNVEYSFEKNKILIVESVPGSSTIDSHIYKFNVKNQIEEIIKPHILTREPLKQLFNYNEYAEISKKETYFWSNNDEDWRFYIEDLYNYSDKGIIASHVQTTHYHRSEDRIEISYDENGYLADILEQTKDEADDKYTNKEKSTLLYNNNGDILESISYIWDESSNLWQGETKYSYRYNMEFIRKSDVVFPNFAVSFSHALFPFFYDIPFEPYYIESLFTPSKSYSERAPNWNMITNHIEYSYSTETETWEEVESKAYYYSENAVIFTNKTKPGIGVYPNPASYFFALEFANTPVNTNIKIYNLKGGKVMDKPVANNEKIYIKHLQGGLYYFKLFVDGVEVESTGKLMIE